MGTFGVGQALRRVEDQRVLTGEGRHCDDISSPGQAVAPLGVRAIDMPAKPERAWRAVRAAQDAEASP